MIRSCLFTFSVGVLMLSTELSVQKSLAQANLPQAVAGETVSIKREACRVFDAQKYRVPLSLEAIHTVTLVAPFDATIKQIVLKTNAKIQPQSEILRFDNTMQKLQFARSQALLKLALLEQKSAGKEEAPAALAQARVDIAKIEVEIVQSQLDLTSLRSPLAGEVQRILVAEGQFVRAGDPLAIVADTSKVKVEIPVERVLAEAGKNISLKIEALETEGRIEAVLPLLPKFDILRDLFDSIASSLVVVENSDGKWKVGQTVYVPLIPRHAVVEVPMTSIGNLTDGQRKVQILRQNVVRDIPISLLGQVGATRTFVSGPFVEGDEVIYESTHQLNDGFQLKTAAGAAGTAGADKSGVPPNPAAKPVGF